MFYSHVRELTKGTGLSKVSSETKKLADIIENVNITKEMQAMNLLIMESAA